jgi:hypothetical protein
VRATLLLTDAAQEMGGKLYILGGGWSVMRPKGPFGFAVAAILQCPWDQANMQHAFRLELLDADGNTIPTADGSDVVHAAGEFEAGRPPGLTPGTPLDVTFVVPFGPLVLEPGRYELRLTIDEQAREDWYLAFTVMPGRPQQRLAA